jgi:MinD-like ATPase involved in chromosome partitioning or flagellar assembly/Tfp pilus assembly protein PilF
MQAAKRPGRVITFYSYKGGTGRSMALANIAWILACNGKRVLTIDWDIEAPGLHRYFRPFLIDAELGSSEGLVDLIDRYATAAIAPVAEGERPAKDWYLEYADFSDHVLGLDFRHFPPGGKIDLLPAGRQTDNYAVKVSSFNWQNFYDRLGGGAFLEAVKDRARAAYDYVLIDSRTGVSDTAGICTAQLPDSLVVCFTYNNQSIKGAAAVARSALATHAKVAEERAARTAAARARDEGARTGVVEDTPRPYVVYPVPMRVDAGESDRLALRQAFARESFADLVSHIEPSDLDAYWSGVEVPHRVFYSYEEVLAPFKDDAHDPKTVLAAFLRLTAYITDREVTDYRLPIAPEVRQGFLEAFAETPLTAQAKKARAESQRETAEQALVRNADAAIYSLGDEEKQAAHKVLSRLVRLSRDEEGGGNFPIRASISDFDVAQRSVIAELARRGVVSVTSEQRGTQTTTLPPPIPGYPNAQNNTRFEQSVGLADGRLVTLWPLLVKALDADREFLLWRQQLRTYLADWDRSGRDSGAFLSGTLLAEAQLWLYKRAGDLNAVERAYVEASAANAQRIEATLLASTIPVQPAAQFSPTAMPATGERRRATDTVPYPPRAPAARAARSTAVLLLGAVVIAALVSGVAWWFARAPVADPGRPSPASAPATAVAAMPTDPSVVTAPARQADAQVGLGDSALARGEAKAAAIAYAAALEIDPSRLEAALKLGRAREAQGDVEGAQRAYERAMTIAPASPAPWLERGANFATQGQFDKAIADYTHAIELDKNDPSAYFNRGAARESLKQTGAAIDDYSAALRLDPKSTPALLARARLTEKSNPAAAIADYRSVLALGAGPADQQLARGRIGALGGKAAEEGAQRVFVQYRDAADLERVDELRKALGTALKPATIAPAEQMASSAGDVRYFFPVDEAFARKAMAETELLLAKQGARVELNLLRREAKDFPRARPGTIEIWLPSLTATQPLPRAAFRQRAEANEAAPNPAAQTPAQAAYPKK